MVIQTRGLTRFVIADRPQTIVYAFTLNLANVDLAVYGHRVVASVETLLSIPPVPGG
jgi:hypothetical protein